MTPPTVRRKSSLVLLYASIILFFCCVPNLGYAHFRLYIAEIPITLSLGSLKLKLTNTLRQQIQVHLNNILQSQSFAQQNTTYLNTYQATIIEELKKANIPLDFSYLALQKLNLDPNNLESQAGFWSFRAEFARQELNLKVTKEIDERLNVITATQSAIKYIQKNQLLFKNWAISLVGLQLGIKNTTEYVKDFYKDTQLYYGVQQLEINESSHDKIKEFIIYKLAFEEINKNNPHNIKTRLIKYEKGANKTLGDIANETRMSIDELKECNKWLKQPKVPNDKTYPVLLPIKEDELIEEIKKQDDWSNQQQNNNNTGNVIHNTTNNTTTNKSIFDNVTVVDPSGEHQTIGQDNAVTVNMQTIKVEERTAPKIHTVKSGDNLYQIARKYSIKLDELKTWNGLSSDAIYPGQTLVVSNIDVSNTNYIKHTVSRGETLSGIARNYSITISELYQWNHLTSDFIREGQILNIFVSAQTYKTAEGKHLFFEKHKQRQSKVKLMKNGK
ncbi:MAG: LysM peptidoglycan-binding domain-containing protein [Cytophagales bacterium]|nr:MAG: LysM peptidoglycan-binding domain-containing protein [Cytophagales bacterium]